MPRGRLASRTATCIAALVCVLVHSTQAAPTGNVTDDPRPGAAAAPAAPLPPAYGAARAPPVTPRAGSTAGGGAAHFNMSYLRPQRSAGAPRNRTREAELRRLADAWRLTAKQAAALGVANAEGAAPKARRAERRGGRGRGPSAPPGRARARGPPPWRSQQAGAPPRARAPLHPATSSSRERLLPKEPGRSARPPHRHPLAFRGPPRRQDPDLHIPLPAKRDVR